MSFCPYVCLCQITELKILLIVSGRAGCGDGAMRSLAARGNRKGNIFWTQGPDFSISSSASAAFCEIGEALEQAREERAKKTQNIQSRLSDCRGLWETHTHRHFREERMSMLGIY